MELSSYQQQIISLRQKGYSISEIAQVVGKSATTVWKLTQEVSIQPEFKQILKSKRGGSALKAQEQWNEARRQITKLLPTISNQHYLIILACLYWAEGAKKEFSFSNTDPQMIKAVVQCLRYVSVSSDHLKITIRIYEDMIPRKEGIAHFWSEILELPAKNISNFNIVSGKKEGKLLYGMCRIRIKRGAFYFKLIQSAISLIGDHMNTLCPHSSTDRATDS